MGNTVPGSGARYAQGLFCKGRTMKKTEPRISVCIGCGCDDNHACVGENRIPCSWLRLDRDAGLGVCSECEDIVLNWDKGDRLHRITFSYNCWNCGSMTPELKTEHERDTAAFKDGWVIGLDDEGQAHYACSYCQDSLYDPSPLRPMQHLLKQQNMRKA